MDRKDVKELAKKLVLATAPVDVEKIVNDIPEGDRGELCRWLDCMSERAAFLGEYVGERYGYGGGDQGHDRAVRAANRRCRKLWTRVFGYNAYLDLSI